MFFKPAEIIESELHEEFGIIHSNKLIAALQIGARRGVEIKKCVWEKNDLHSRCGYLCAAEDCFKKSVCSGQG